MRLVDLVRRETGAQYSEIMLLRHSNDSISKLLACGATVEEYTAMQPTGSKWDFWAEGKLPIDVVAVIVEKSLYGVFRILGVEAVGTTFSISSSAHRRFDIERGKSERPARRFSLQRVPTPADSLAVTGWERKEISPVLRSKNPDGLFWKIEVNAPEEPIYVESVDLTEMQLAAAIRSGGLRFEMVITSSTEALVRRRKGQDVLRKLALECYRGRCAICDVEDPELLRASHIVGWAEREDTRGHLNNVICLCVFHDALFEHGYWSLDDGHRVLKRPNVKSDTVRALLHDACEFRQPPSYPPATEYIRFHRLKHGFCPAKKRR